MDAQSLAIVVAIIAPTFTLAGRFLFDRRDPSAFRRMKRHSELWGLLPTEAKPHMEKLIVAETKRYADRRVKRSERTLNGATLAALIFVGLATALLTWPLVLLALVFWPAWIAAALVALFGVLLMIAGTGQLYTYPGDEPRKPRNSKK